MAPQREPKQLLVQKEANSGLNIINVSDYNEEDEARMSPEQLEKVRSIMLNCNQMSRDQLLMIQAHEEQLRRAEAEVADAVESSRKAGEELKKASGHKFKTLKYKLGLVFGGIGGAVGGVFGLAPGLVLGSAGGAAVGTAIGSKIDKAAKKKHGALEFEGAK